MSASVADDKHLHRLILFSDAVFAIAITLLAIEITSVTTRTPWGDAGVAAVLAALILAGRLLKRASA